MLQSINHCTYGRCLIQDREFMLQPINQCTHLKLPHFKQTVKVVANQPVHILKAALFKTESLNCSISTTAHTLGCLIQYRFYAALFEIENLFCSQSTSAHIVGCLIQDRELMWYPFNHFTHRRLPYVGRIVYMVANQPVHTQKIALFRTDRLCGSQSTTATTVLIRIDSLCHSQLTSVHPVRYLIQDRQFGFLLPLPLQIRAC